MCGIAGIVDTGAGLGGARLRELVLCMRDKLVHRGPDDAGVWVDPQGRCAMAHRRLSVLDLSANGRQPLGNEDESVRVSFNGEIYNFHELRSNLEDQGHTFHSHTDTEVLAHLFESFGFENLRRLKGMFAFGVWHASRRKLLLARDPFGKKPMYYCHGPGWFAFASELSAISCLPGVDKTIDRDAIAEYLLLQYVNAPRTIFRGVKKLLPGSYLELDVSDSNPSERGGRFYTFNASAPDATRPPERSLEDDAEGLRQVLIEAVQKRLLSDVPLGAFLSGGLDSTLVTAIMAKELKLRVKTFCIGFEGTRQSEHAYGRMAAEMLGTEHHEKVLKPNILEGLPVIAELLDEPLGDSSCLPTLLLSRFTRQHVTVALSGDGGDEMFGGYARYGNVLRAVEAGSASASDTYLSNNWLVFAPIEVAGIMGGRLPESVEQLMDGMRQELEAKELPVLHRMRKLDVRVYLPGAVLTKVDRMSMQVALEVRCPLLDTSIAAFASALPLESCWKGETGKRVIRKLLARYMPEDFIARPKMGFGVPDDSWSFQPLMSLAREILLPADAKLANYVDHSVLRGIVNRQSLQFFSMYEIWNLLILELWLRMHT